LGKNTSRQFIQTKISFIHPDEGLQAILRDVNREPQFSDKKDKGLFEKEKDDYFVKITQ
jgi:hypothetical protein